MFIPDQGLYQDIALLNLCIYIRMSLYAERGSVRTLGLTVNRMFSFVTCHALNVLLAGYKFTAGIVNLR